MNFYSKNSAFLILIYLTAIFVGALFFKGDIDRSGKLSYQAELSTKTMGPFEASNSNSRYALVESIIKHRRFDFSNRLAAFSSPDLSFYNGKYFSIFAPGVSFFVAPFYSLGQIFKTPQLFSYASMLIVAAINSALVYLIAKKFTSSNTLSLLAGLIFFFCTNSIVYAMTLTQHQLTILTLLLACLNNFYPRSVKTNLSLGAVYGFAILVDLPNALLLFPPIGYAMLKTLKTHKGKKYISLSILSFSISLSIFASVYAYYNSNLTGSILKFGQSLGRTIYPSEKNQTPRLPEVKNELISTPFKTRSQTQGLQVLLLGNERGWLFYSPILFLSIMGFYLSIRHRPDLSVYTTVLLSVLIINIVTYSMFGDPWGGWSFGARYLLPGAAITSIFVAVSLHYLRKNLIYVLLLGTFGLYSIGVNLVGAATTTLIPPKQEAVYLGPGVKYTFQRSIEMLENNQSGSLVFNAVMGQHLSAVQYVICIYLLVSLVFLICLVASIRTHHVDK